MAHSALHFSAGMLTAAIWAVPALIRARLSGKPLANRFLAWMLLGLALGAYATVPAWLGRLGIAASLRHSPWANVFLFYGWIHAWKPGGRTSGPVLLSLLFGMQYAVLLLAILDRKRRKRPGAPRRT